jgi:hypothetical protein
MHPEKLLEAALLDAGGLLEAEESAEFELAFASAPAELRAQIRREQARFADLSDVLPDVMPRRELREQVIAAVREAIGRRRDAIGHRLLAHAAVERATARLGHRRGLMLWRLSSFAFATIAVTVGVIAFQLHRDMDTLSQRIASNQAADLFLRMAPNTTFRDAVLGSEYTRMAMIPTQAHSDTEPASGEQPEAALFYNDKTGEAHLGFFRLPSLKPGEVYEIVMLGDGDTIGRRLHSFTSAGEIGSATFRLNGPMNGPIALVSRSAAGAVIMLRTT